MYNFYRMYNGKNNTTEQKCGKDNKEDTMINYNDNDLFRKYIHDIRNMKILDKEMINNIRNMSNEEKIEIIIALNDNIEYIKAFIE